MNKKIDKFWYWFLCVIAFVICFMFGVANNTKAYSLDSNGNLVSDNLFNGNLQDGAWIFTDGNYTWSNEYRSSTNFIEVVPGSTITLSAKGNYTVGGSGFVFFNNGVYVGYADHIFTVTVPANANQVMFNIFIGSSAFNLTDVQLEYGTIATAFEPYGVWYSENNLEESSYREGYNDATNNSLNIVATKSKELNSDELLTPTDYFCNTYSNGALDCSEALKNYVNDAYIYGAPLNDQEIYEEGFVNGQTIGYQQASDDGKVMGNFVPSLLGGFGSFFLTILNIDFFGFSLLSVLGIVITILGVIVIIKFLKG